jgi:hypothetical protein
MSSFLVPLGVLDPMRDLWLPCRALIESSNFEFYSIRRKLDQIELRILNSICVGSNLDLAYSIRFNSI